MESRIFQPSDWPNAGSAAANLRGGQVGQVRHDPVRFTFLQCLQRCSTGGHGECARTDVSAAGDVPWRVADHDDLRAV